MTKLTDLQSLLLSAAAARTDGNLGPPPESVAGDPARVMRAIAQLLRRGLLMETELAGAGVSYRADGDLRYGAFITAAGLAAIGAEPPSEARLAPIDAPAPQAGLAPRQTKTTLVVDLLQREQGVTLTELVAATGWLPHTTRAALTGLRKKGHAIERSQRDGANCAMRRRR